MREISLALTVALMRFSNFSMGLINFALSTKLIAVGNSGSPVTMVLSSWCCHYGKQGCHHSVLMTSRVIMMTSHVA